MNFIWSKTNDPLLGDILKNISNDTDTKRKSVLTKFFPKVQNAVISILKDRAKIYRERKTTISLERLFIQKYDSDNNPVYTQLGLDLKHELQQDINFNASELATYGNQLIIYMSTQNLFVKLLNTEMVHAIKIIVSWEDSKTEKNDIVESVEIQKDTIDLREVDI